MSRSHLSISLVLLAGCGGSPPPLATPPPQPATAAPPAEPPPTDPLGLDEDAVVQIRFLHAAGAFADKALEASAGPASATPLFPRLPFQSAAPYTAVQSSGGVDLVAKGEGIAEVTSRLQAAPGTHHTVIIFTDPDDAAKIALATIPDDAPRPVGDAVRARIFHALRGTGPVDVCGPGAARGDPPTPFAFGVGYGTVSGGHMDLPGTAPFRLQLRAASQEACSGRQVGVVELSAPAESPIDRQNITLFATSRPSGRRAETREVYVSVDQPPSSGSFTVPLASR